MRGSSEGLGEGHSIGEEVRAAMPTYEYECTKCGERFAQRRTFEQFDRGKGVKCPKCSSTKVQQLLSTAFAKTSKKS
jgi:putative FmdB family regulatory protein